MVARVSNGGMTPTPKPQEEVHRYLYRWGQHSGSVYAASTEEARRVIEASGISSTSELFIEMVLTR